MDRLLSIEEEHIKSILFCHTGYAVDRKSKKRFFKSRIVTTILPVLWTLKLLATALGV